MKALSFEGSGFEYFKIWIVNILLTIVTLGLYYPWAKVRNNRYFYANSTLEGRNFEYHATGKQLFVGYLIAMSIFILYILIETISPIGSLILLLVGFLAIPWVIWRSLKFNMRMSSFSNVRFSFAGELGGAYVNFLLLPIAFIMTVYILPIVVAVVIPMYGDSISAGGGLFTAIALIVSFALAFYIYAFMKKRNASYTINGYRYGQGEFSTNIETKTFAMILLKTIGLSILLLILFMVLVAIVAGTTVGLNNILSMGGNMNDPEAMNELFAGGIMIVFVLMYVGLIFLSLLIVAYSYTRQRTYILANSNLDDKITFESTLKATSLSWVMITNFLAVIFTLALALPWAKVRMARLMLENTHVDTEQGFDEYLTQQQGKESSLGEQLGDAFDVDVGIGF